VWWWEAMRAAERATWPVDAEFAAAMARRWAELPAGVRTPGQVLGRHAVGCEGTHGGGLHWHPAGADTATSPDMLLARGPVSLATGKRLVTEWFFTACLADGSLPRPYRCAI
jgi:hypothetical protein